MAVSQSISDLEYAALQAKFPGTPGSLADLRMKNAGGPVVNPSQSVTDLEYKQLAGTGKESITDLKFKQLGGPSIPPTSISDLFLKAGGSVGGGFDPTTISGLQAWYKADGPRWKDAARTIPATADGDAIAVWDDSSPSARHATQATPAKQPALKLSLLNSKPGVHFTGANLQQLSTAAGGFLNAQPLTIIAVIRPASVAGNQNYVGSAVGGAATFAMQTNHFYMYCGGQNLVGTKALAVGSSYILAGVMQGATSRGWVGGGVSDFYGDSSSGNASLNGLCLGAYVTGSGADNANGDIFEVLAYNKALSTAELDSIGNYLATKYGLPWAPATVPAPFNPLTTIPWHSAFWAEDPAWAHPADGVAVPSWRDGSGNARDLLQATGIQQPIYKAVTAGLNNRPSVLFDGINDRLLAALAAPIVPPYSMVLVAQRLGPGTTFDNVERLMSGTTPQITMGYPTAGKYGLYNGGVIDSTIAADTLKHFFAVIILPGGGTFIVDATTKAGAPGTSNFSNNILLASQNAGSTDYANIAVGFAGVFAGDITADPGWAALKSGLATMYGVTTP